MHSQNSKSEKHNFVQPNKIDQWIKYGAGSLGVCPDNGLPNWFQLQLDKKIPVVPKPESIVYSRGPVGKKLLPLEKLSDFRLYDPYGYTTNMAYDSLHDPHLTRHLQKEAVREQLKNQGNINADGGAICDIKTLNKYRNFRRFMNLDHVHRQMRQLENEKIEKRRLIEIEENLKKQNTKWALKQKIEEAGIDVKKDRAEKQLMARERWLHNKHVIEQKIEKLQNKKELYNEDRKLKGKQKDEQIKFKIKGIKNDEHKKRLILIRNLRQRDENLINKKENRKNEIYENRLKKVEEKWENKKKQMIKQDLESQKELFETQYQFTINVDRRKAIAATLKHEQKLLAVKNRLKAISERAEQRRMVQGNRIQKSVFGTLTKHGLSQDTENMEYIIRKSYNSTIAELNRKSMEGTDSYNIITALKETVEKQKNTPIPVLYVIDYILEKVIEESAKNTLKPIIEKLNNEVYQFGADNLTCLRLSRSKTKNKVIQNEDNFIHRKGKPMPHKKLGEKKDNSLENYLINGDNQNIGLSLRNQAISTRGTETSGNPKNIVNFSINFEKRRSILKDPLTVQFDSISSEEQSLINKDLNKSMVKFGKINEFCVLEFPDNLKKIGQRKRTPMPSLEVLTSTAWDDPFVESELSETELTFKAKDDLEKLCKKTMKVVKEAALKIVAAAVEPITRQSTILKLAKMKDANVEEIATNVSKEILGIERPVWSLNLTRNKKKMAFEEEAACLIARKAINTIFKPTLFIPKKNDNVLRYKIMFINHFK